MLYLAGGVTCCVLKPKASRAVCLLLNAAVTLMLLLTLRYTMRTGSSYVFTMGHFPAPWGNEIRVGPAEALLGAVLSGVMLLTLLGGMEHILADVEESKLNLYFTVCNLLMVSLLALVFTNDLFTGYVFVEINTIASCALVMIRYRSGKALAATARYLMMSLLGSGLFLMGIVILYGITGHLLMEPLRKSLAAISASGEYTFPLTVVIGLFAAGMGLKSALWPFHEWLPDAHSSATAASSGILSGLVLKGYIILLIKIMYRVIGIELIDRSRISSVLYVFGLAAMTFGSLGALREKDLKRMLAYSSVAQIGYIYVGIGLGSQAGFLAALVQIIAHAFTKPLLFTSAGGFMSVSGESRQLKDLHGAGRRDPLSGIAFLIGALSMIGLPLFAGFVTKFTLTRAVLAGSGWKTIPSLAVIVLSTVLNALYYLPVVVVLFRSDDTPYAGTKAGYEFGFVVAVVLFILLNFLLGLGSDRFLPVIEAGLEHLA